MLINNIMSIIHINGSSKPNQLILKTQKTQKTGIHHRNNTPIEKEIGSYACPASRECVLECVCVCVVFRSSSAQLPNKHTPSLRPPAEFLSGSELNHWRAHAATTQKTSILETRAPPDYSSSILKALPIVLLMWSDLDTERAGASSG